LLRHYCRLGTLEVCKDVSSNQVQTTLSLDPASKAEVDSAVSATMRDVVTRGVKNAVVDECVVGTQRRRRNVRRRREEAIQRSMGVASNNSPIIILNNGRERCGEELRCSCSGSLFGEEDLVIFKDSITETVGSRNVWEICIGYFHCLSVLVS
jgi:K+-sensing histidine kinase KdpD